MNLKAPCPHGRYEEHPCIDGKWVSQLKMMRITDEERPRLSMCPGGSLLPPDSLVIVKEADGSWPKSVTDVLANLMTSGNFHDYGWEEEPIPEYIKASLDALAAAQRSNDGLA